MSFAALCGSQVWNSVIPSPPEVAASASATAAELCGCALASSAGGLKSTSVSLLELSPTPGPKSSPEHCPSAVAPCSEPSSRVLSPELAGPVCPLETKDRGSDRKHPDLQEERMAALTRAADSAAPTPPNSIPGANTNTNTTDLACPYFTVVTGWFGSNCLHQSEVETDGKKAGRSRGRF